MLTTEINWRPTATTKTLQHRATILKQIRQFFETRHVLEVETPVLCASTATDPHINSFSTTHAQLSLYLQTSPEFSMKRLLASGSGPIFQICKVFRDGEMGKQHNPEFTMLEWYRPGFDHHQLMREVDALLQAILKTSPSIYASYTEIFNKQLSINPITDPIEKLKACAIKHGLNDLPEIDADDRDTWLDLLMSHLIQPHLGLQNPIMIYDYPASQAALAKIHPDNPQVAQRFEAFYCGIELANGYHELVDAKEQKRRFKQDQIKRQQLNLPETPVDERLLAALDHGLPECAGVALGIDRLIMLATNAKTIKDVISFPTDRA